MRAVNLLPLERAPGNRLTTVGREAPARRVLAGAGIAAGVLALLVAVLALHRARRRQGPARRRSRRRDPGRRRRGAGRRGAGGPGRQPPPARRLPDGRRPADRLGGRPPRPLAGAAGERLAVEPQRASPTLTAGAASAPAVPVAAAPAGGPGAVGFTVTGAPTRRSGSHRCSTGSRSSPGCRT